MLAEWFYKSEKSKNAIPLELIKPEELEAKLGKLSIKERSLLNIQQFKANLGSLGLVLSEEGALVRVYIGSGPNEMLAIAAAVLSLPQGEYTLSQTVEDKVLLNWSLAQYKFTKYKKFDPKLKILCLKSEEQKNKICSLAKAIFFTRDLINEPTNKLGPKELGEAVAILAENYSAKYEEWVDEELLSANFPAIHAVGKASANRPRLLSLTWGQQKHPLISIIGKGVCFDSGGLDIKSSPVMRLMKKDMGGAANALGLALWIIEQNLPIRIQVLIPAVENSIGPDSFRPGDVIIMRNGISVEIDNTDAEGRLVLADAISKASELNPALIIDLSTLTGAARAAVGTDIAAMFTNDQSLAKDLMEASDKTQDYLWQLPLHESYESLLDSGIADMVNSSPSPYAGAITAALFIKRFIPANTPWVHFDMGAWNFSSKPGKPEGGEAMAIRALGYYLQKKYG